MRSLRSRLILSHTLPMLLITSLMGIVLIFVLETQVILVNLSTQLVGQATLIADIARDYPHIWTNPTQAQAFVRRFNADMAAELMLLHPDGHLLASSNPSDTHLQGEILPHPGLARVRTGATNTHVNYSQDLRANAADVVVPVFGPQQQVVGVIRLTHELASVYQRFQRVRYFVAGVLIPGLLLGIGIGLLLALTLKRPLDTLTHAIYQVTNETQLTALPEQGPVEIQLVARAFNTLIERLRMLEAARRQLLANLVHELARPIGAMRAATYALQNGASEDEALRHYLLAGMEAEMQRLQRLLDDLSQLYDKILGPLELNRQPIALSRWLPICLAPWQQIAQQKGLAWQVVIPDSLPTLLIDPDRLGQAVGNLLSNAIKYTPSGDTVSVVAERTVDGIQIRVSDSGPGIEPQEQSRIFEPFYRSHMHRRFPQGMGLGLTIARDLVVAHGGQLEMESTPGQGSHFTLRLPVPSG